MNQQITPSDRATLKVIYSMIMTDNKRRYPSNPYPVAPKPYKIYKTSQLEAATEKIFHLYGYKSVRRTHVTGRQLNPDVVTYNQITGKWQTIDKGKYIPTTGRVGEADLHGNVVLKEGAHYLNKMGLLMSCSVSLAIEIKNQYTNDRMRPEQQKYKEDFERDGGLYLVFRNITDVMQWIDENLEKRVNY